MSTQGKTQTWPDLAGRLSGAGHVLPVRVYYEDTDFTGVVYHAAYLKFIERGRSDFLRVCDIHHNELEDGKHGEALAFAVRHMDINFLRPARIDDVLEVVTRLESLKGARLVLHQEVTRGEETLFTATVTVAVIQPGGGPRRMPKHLAERLLAASALPS
ncbi:tol-pal system-associated acyl-CoA thioesterase [Pseudovibrio sp. SPO723]|uniref:tol-pal system-associated acyl-CoA thioesterase n=1 Tax=Nesiotobacter zosterae TaxID=392721 RepID=UPI0029C27631|nr:tol-pal system-associated acyl-CoA thioesterase [Pseudovibrio sp. SPO723]MDX5595420.1 tol-pal system-associated acyl-CoA thioesterase [Pseudovibrio sp. SPO723]